MRKLLSVFAAFAMALTILTGSIALPLVARPFYRAQIEPLGIPARSGLTAEQIGAAFDDVMDYCLGKRPDFAAGVLSFSPEGASHFADVRRLFLLDLRVLAVCMAVLLVLYALRRKKGPDPESPGGPQSRLLGRLRPGRGAGHSRRPGGPGLRPGLHGVPHHLLPRQGQLAL